jgi:hybrid cluster-associated redox disulfide protein
VEIKMAKTEDKTSGITKDMLLGDIVQRYPEATEAMLKHGLHCIGCHVSFYETLEQGALVHGMTPKELDSMVLEMNALVKKSKK